LVNPAVQTWSHRIKDQNTLKFLEWLSPGSSYYTIYDGIREKLIRTDVKLQDIGNWFLESKEFQKWAVGYGSNFLCCYGLRTQFMSYFCLQFVSGSGKISNDVRGLSVS
jgi:hypothetical protein